MVEEPVQDGGGEDLVAEDLTAYAEGLVRGQKDTSSRRRAGPCSPCSPPSRSGATRTAGTATPQRSSSTDAVPSCTPERTVQPAARSSASRTWPWWEAHTRRRYDPEPPRVSHALRPGTSCQPPPPTTSRARTHEGRDLAAREAVAQSKEAWESVPEPCLPHHRIVDLGAPLADAQWARIAPGSPDRVPGRTPPGPSKAAPIPRRVPVGAQEWFSAIGVRRCPFPPDPPLTGECPGPRSGVPEARGHPLAWR